MPMKQRPARPKPKPKLFSVTVVWEAVAELKIRARNADEADTIARNRGLPWKKAVEGDTDHHQIEVEPD